METITANGVNGQISFDGNVVRITRAGFFGRVGHGRGEKTLNVRSIGAVQIKPASALVNGFIQFSVSGESSKQSIGFGRSQDAAQDENAVIFAKKSTADFEAVRDAVLAALAGGSTPAPAVDHAEQLTKLAALRDAGVITTEEFDAKKAEILERM
ncbi:hypothetical protein J2X55_002381 [Microbacterium sp. 1154]|uniref:DUF4429 domain-containing protein n=1 Tax=Microbacterium sp. 1154 TaxID=2817733 RepID=UPI00285461AC|nr:DUF4429 domain-containing protein [Microbacterium sp. 1154]MDR6691458.1 hypothetical protein [Microbacterium sp. 1154]